MLGVSLLNPYPALPVLPQIWQRVSGWRNIFGSTAIDVVSKYFEDELRFATPGEVAMCVQYLLGAGEEIPWLWKNRFESPRARVVCNLLYVI